MNKILTTILTILLLISSVFTMACSKENRDIAVGTYNFYSLKKWTNKDENESITVKVGEDYYGYILTEFYVGMEIKSDGNVLSSSLPISNHWHEAKWRRDGEKIIITAWVDSCWDEETGEYVKNQKSFDCTYADDTLTITNEEGILVMKKTKPSENNPKKYAGKYKFYKQNEKFSFGEEEILLTFQVGGKLGDYTITENYLVIELRAGGLFVFRSDYSISTDGLVGWWKTEGTTLILLGSNGVAPANNIIIEDKTITIIESEEKTIVLKK